MTARLSHAMHQAIEQWPSLDRDAYISNMHAIAYLSLQAGVSASGLYRALVRTGHIVKRPRKRKKAKR